MWDPAQYLTFADQRSRPFFDLVGRIGATAPSCVVDLGCGPGQLTAALADRWPTADVLGVDSSAEMIDAASALLADRAGAASAAAGQLAFRIEDLTDWLPTKPVDVMVSNAVLQWVPGHLELLALWADQLAPDGWLAFQLPGNFDQPSHAILRELAGSDRWRGQLTGVQFNRQAADPAEYLDVLASCGLAVDAWETTYLHVLTGPDPVTEWYKGSGLRPVLNRLAAADSAEFLAEYSARAAVAYPPASYGTVLPFRRVFAVAHKV